MKNGGSFHGKMLVHQRVDWDVNGDLLHRETGHVGHRPIETGDLGDLIIFDIHHIHLKPGCQTKDTVLETV